MKADLKILGQTNRLLAGALELVGEFLDATSGVDETLFTRVGRMGIHGDVADDHVVFFTIDLLLARRGQSGLSQELLAGGNVLKADVVLRRM